MTPDRAVGAGSAPEPGSLIAEFGPFPVEWGKAREIAIATFDDAGADRYAPSEEARRDPPFAPPTYTMVQALWGASLDELPLGLEPTRILDGEYRFDYLKPIRVGDWLVGRTRYLGRTAKRGRKVGSFNQVKVETTFHDAQTDEAVLVATRTVLEFEEPPRWERP